MKVLVTGGCGQLGRTMMDVSRDAEHEFIFTDIKTSEEVVALDITDREAVGRIIKENAVDVIFNFAGYTDVEKAEAEDAVAFKINAEAVGVLADAAKDNDALLVHISTDYVFDGRSFKPYDEDSEPAPLSAYGRSKLAGELAVLGSGCRHIIIRTSWLYSQYGRNFVKTILARSSEKPTMKVVSDQIGSPTYAGDLAEFLLQLLEPENLCKEGVYNYTNEGVCSWYDLAWEVCDQSGNLCDILPCRTGEYPVNAARPPFSVLDKAKVKLVFGIEIPNWKDSLRYCLTKLL